MCEQYMQQIYKIYNNFVILLHIDYKKKKYTLVL